MNALAIIQARMDSSRLPGKMALPLFAGMNALEIMVKRLEKSRSIGKLVVATSIRRSDDVIAGMCARMAVPCYRGDADDVLDRYYSAYLAHGPADAVIRLTGDSPFADPQLADLVIDRFFAERADYAVNTFPPTYPDGLGVEVFTPAVLERMWREARLPSEREHVTQYIYHHPEQFSFLNVAGEENFSEKRWTLDNPEDLEFIRAALAEMGGIDWGWRQLIALLGRKPELETINSALMRDEGLRKSQLEDTAVAERPAPEPWEGRGQDLYRRAKRLIPGGTQLLSKRPEMYLPDGWPAYYAKAKGMEVWDTDGRRYYDFTNMSVGACPLGYADADVDAAVREAVARGNMCTLNSPEEVELAELLLEIHPWADNVRYARGGGDAMAVAVRIARATTGRDKLAICGYSGWHDWYLAVNIGDTSALDGHHLPGLDPAGTPRALKDTATTFMNGDVEALENIIAKHGNNLAAIVMEPLRNAIPPKGYLDRVKSLAHSCGALLIFDEISSAFKFCCCGAHLSLGTNPDMAVIAKGMSNGFPMGAVIGSASAMSGAERSFISSTYWTDRVGPAAALACIRKYRALKVHEHQIQCGTTVMEAWKTLGLKHGLPIQVGGLAPMAHFSFSGEFGLAARTVFTKIMLSEGYLAGNGFNPNLAHTQEGIEAYIQATDKAFAEIAKIGLSPALIDRLRPCGVAHSGFKRLN